MKNFLLSPWITFSKSFLIYVYTIFSIYFSHIGEEITDWISFLNEISSFKRCSNKFSHFIVFYEPEKRKK